MRNLAKGFFSMVLVVALLLGGMVGASASEKVEITIGGLDYVYMPMVVEAFNAANPDIHLTYMPDVGNVDDGTLQAVLQSGLGPDIIGTGSGAGRIGPLAKNGLIQPINAIYDEYKLWDRYQPFVVDALKKTVNDGNIYEVLEGLDVFQIYYNIEIFEKVGVEPPKTWDEFTQVCDKLLAAGYTPLANGFRGGLAAGWLVGQFFEAYAGSDAMNSIIYSGAKMSDYPAFEQVFQLVYDFGQKGYFNQKDALALDAGESEALFYNGVYPMFGAAHSVLLRAAAADDSIDLSKFAAFAVPSAVNEGVCRPTMGLAHSWVLNAQVDESKMDAVKRYFAFLSSDEYCRIAMGNGGNLIPAITPVPDDTEMNAIMQQASDALNSGAGYNPSVFLPGTAKQAYYEGLQGVLDGQTTPAQAVEAIDAGLSAQ